MGGPRNTHGETRNVTKCQSEQFKGNYFGNLSMNENTQMHVNETGRQCMDWIRLAVGRDQ